MYLLLSTITILLVLTNGAEPKVTTYASQAVQEVKQYKGGNIVVGVGYSSDSQQVVSQVCYNATISSTSAQQGYVHLDTSLSFSEIENQFGIAVSIGGRIGMFSVGAKASYIRSVKDQDYSMSMNYFTYVTNNVAVELAGYGEGALTESGKDFYNAGKNKYFRLACGDHYITSYQQGALLALGLNIKFISSIAKREFEEKAGVSVFGDIFRATESVKQAVIKFKTTGTVVIQAFQIGGEPSQLAKLLNKDRAGEYYALTCSLTSMDNCIKAATGLLDYAKDNFTTQISFQNNIGLTPLGIGFSQYNPIEYIGLTPPVSLVTPEVVQYRDQLASRLKENEYYQEKLHPIFSKAYPVELHTNFISNANSILNQAKTNMAVLMQAHGGAIDCFNFPDECKMVKAGIDSHMKNILPSDLKFLDDIKYTVTTLGGVFYNTGSGKAWGSPQWVAVPNNKPGEANLVKVANFTITEKIYSYNSTVDLYPPGTGSYEIRFNGSFNSHSMKYIGEQCRRKVGSAEWVDPCQSDFEEAKIISSFFFEPFQ